MRRPDFTVSFVTVDTMVDADYVDIVSGKKGHDKTENTVWTSLKTENANVPVFDCLLITMECRIKKNFMI